MQLRQLSIPYIGVVDVVNIKQHGWLTFVDDHTALLWNQAGGRPCECVFDNSVRCVQVSAHAVLHARSHFRYVV